MDDLTNLMARNGFLPHGYCFSWSPGLLWSMVGADLTIALSYFAIPLVIVTYTRQRPQVNLGGLATLSSLFILFCGVTHAMDVWTIWQPDYVVQTGAKVATAAISLLTAVMAWRLLPRALAIPSVDELRAALAKAQAETERRRSAEEHLSETEQSLAVTLATIDAGFITTDDQGLVTRINSVAERLTGWPSADALGRSVWQVVDRVGRPPELTARNPVDIVREQGLSATSGQAMVCIARDGTETPVALNAEITRRADGRVRGIALILRDVSRVTAAETEARRLAAVVESSSDAIIVKTLEGRITNWNAAAEAMFGYRADEAVGQPIQMLLPPERETEEMSILAEVARGRAVAPFRTVRVAKDGRRLDVSIQVSPLRDAAGRVIGAAKSARDLTHQRQIEAALRHSETRLRVALESAALGDWEYDPASGQVHRSRRCDLCFGLAESPPRWTLADLKAAVHPDDRGRVEAALERALASAATVHEAFRVIWPDGSEHWLQTDARPVAGDGATPRLVGIVADVTTTRLAEQARQQAERLEAENLRVQESNRMKSQFLANMSHELRTPLNGIIGFSGILMRGIVAPGSDKAREYLGHIAASGEHLLRVINDVLDLSKIEAGKLEFDAQPVDLARLFDDVASIVSPQAAARDIALGASIDPGLHDLVLDPVRLRQVVLNYVGNAIKFTEAGGRVDVRALGEGPAHWRLEVEDTGIGIREADLGRLFVEFQQLDGSFAKRYQGTGLGLALTRRLVEAQGGRVGVYSRPGEGSLFYAVLPRRHPPAAETDAGVRGASDDDGDRPRMLVAARDHATRDGLARGLSVAGIGADVAGSAAEVVELARVRRYTGLTLDLTLADTPGRHALADLRRSGASAEAPIRALGVSSPAGALTLPVSDVVAKPLAAAEVARVLGRAGARPDGVVLVVDDDAAARELMRAALTAIGVPSEAVGSGAEALSRLPALRPAAMVLDLMMPGLDGFEVLHRLRADARWRDLPVFVWTAMTLTAAEHAQLSKTAQALLDKSDGGSLDATLDALRRWAHAHPEAAPARG